MKIEKAPKSIKEVLTAYKENKYTPSELVEFYFAIIKERNGELNAVLEIFEDALERAKICEANFRSGTIRKLEGIPFLVKDCILVKGKVASSGSQMLKNYVATYDSTVIKKLKEEGAIILGRTNMDEFALGGDGTNSSYGPTKNPINTEYVPGGSSSGSAAAVAGELCLISIGSDTGGSIREPAALCGIYGYKPSYGFNSRSGLIAAASSLDTIGFFANNLEDIKICEQVVSGEDIMDNTTIPDEIRPTLVTKENKKVIAYPENFLNNNAIQKEVKENFFKSLEEYKQKGFTILPVNMENLKYALSVYYVINTAEVSTNLSRFDGLRYGGGDIGEVRNYQELFAKNRGKFFGPEVKRRIMLGSYVLGTGYYDAYYGRAIKLREVLKQEFNKVFEEADFIAMPTSPFVAWKTTDLKDPISLYLADIFTVTANLVGVPGINIPNGYGQNDLPTGIQILGKYGDDQNLLNTFK